MPHSGINKEVNKGLTLRVSLNLLRNSQMNMEVQWRGEKLTLRIDMLWTHNKGRVHLFTVDLLMSSKMKYPLIWIHKSELEFDR